MKKLRINRKVVALVLSAAIGLTSSSYVVVKQVEYKRIISRVDSDLERENQKFIDVLEDLNIESVSFTSVGNSIGSGYSSKDEVVPLMKRNTNLDERLNNKSISTEYYQFARPQDNSDEHAYDWLVNNTKLSEVNEQIRYDYLGLCTGVDSTYISTDRVYEYYPVTIEDDKGLNDIISNNRENHMNIIVYNGGTGSFLDNITRGSEEVFDSFERDKESIESFCKYIYLKNPHVQIYICGLPNFFNLGITELVNKKYRKLAEFYPNVTYVESAPLKVFYSTKDGTKLDIHHSKEEYLCLNKNIIESISGNYISNKISIDLSIAMRSLSQEIQFKNRLLYENREPIELTIYKVLDYYKNLNINASDIIKGIDQFIKVYKLRFGYDFCYTSKNIALEIFKEYKEKLSKSKIIK